MTALLFIVLAQVGSSSGLGDAYAFDLALFWQLLAAFLSPYYPWIGVLFTVGLALTVLGWLLNLRK